MGLLGISDWAGNQDQVYEKLIQEAMFRTRCAIPCIIQSYDASNNTVECQPAIREKVVAEDRSVSYQQIPLLINVPVVFPGGSAFELKFPIQRGDECLVVFSDLSIDNFWLHGNLQNPVELRRHDLSDGIAIPCRLSLPKLEEEPQFGITVDNEGLVTIKCSKGTITSNQLYSIIHDHYHRTSDATGTYSSGGPLGVED